MKQNATFFAQRILSNQIIDDTYIDQMVSYSRSRKGDNSNLVSLKSLARLKETSIKQYEKQ